MAKITYPIPERMKHLKVDDRGYPIPYFALIRDGHPDFRYQDAGKARKSINGHLCAICGQKLPKDYAYVISGPKGYENRVSSDAAMHRECADYSINVCPHLIRQKADRRSDTSEQGVIDLPYQGKDKPDHFVLVKIKSNYNIFHDKQHGAYIIRYIPVSVETYAYVNGLLQKQNT